MESNYVSVTERQKNFEERRAMLMSKQLQEDYTKLEEVRAFEMATIILAKEYAHNVEMGNTEGLFELNARVDLMAKQLAIKHV